MSSDIAEVMPAGVKFVNVKPYEQMDAETGGDELVQYTINGQTLIVPWWGSHVVIDRNNKVKVFPGKPIRTSLCSEGGAVDWIGTDCERFEEQGMIIADAEVNGAFAEEFMLSLCFFDHVVI